MTQSNAGNKEANLITEELFREAYQYEEVKKPPLGKVIWRNLKCSKDTALNFFPVARWISQYSLREFIVGDIIAGLTVAVMHIPHGLAYAPLGRVDPVVGFYMAIFPVFVYMFLGTSRHISIGTFAVLCAMVGHIVMKYEVEAPAGGPGAGNATNATLDGLEERRYSGLEVGSAVCIMVGLWQAALGLLKLGSLTVIMSESLVSGFTTGAAVHVLSYQLKNLFGVKVASFSGVLKLLYIYIDFFSKIKSVNLVTMSMSIVCIIVLLFFNEYVKPVVQKKFPKNKIPVPIELLVIIGGILASYLLKLEEEYGVGVVGHIPTGMPLPRVPPVDLLRHLVLDSLVVAIVALAINLSLARIFAKKGNYTVSSNQEFVAYGVANIFASFFRCLPSAASLSRSSIQFAVGGKSQLASLFSVAFIIFILLVAGSLFEPVPYCVLSSIVVVTLKGLLMQVTELCRICRQNYWDGIVWLGTFTAVVVLDLDYGLGVGILLSLATMVFGSYRLRAAVLGRVPNTNVFLDIDRYKSAQPLPNVLILQITGNLNFSNSGLFEKIVIGRFRQFSPGSSSAKQQTYFVLNMSAVTEIDPTSVNSLRHLCKYLKTSKCDLYLTDCNVRVYGTFEVCGLFKDLPKDQILASVADAVDYLTVYLTPGAEMFPTSLEKNIRELDRQISLLETECDGMEAGKREGSGKVWCGHEQTMADGGRRRWQVKGSENGDGSDGAREGEERQKTRKESAEEVAESSDGCCPVRLEAKRGKRKNICPGMSEGEETVGGLLKEEIPMEKWYGGCWPEGKFCTEGKGRSGSRGFGSGKRRPRSARTRKKSEEVPVDIAKAIHEKEMGCVRCNEEREERRQKGEKTVPNSNESIKTLQILVDELKTKCSRGKRNDVVAAVQNVLVKIMGMKSGNGVRNPFGSFCRRKEMTSSEGEEVILEQEKALDAVRKFWQELSEEKSALMEELRMKDKKITNLKSKEKEYLSLISNLKFNLERLRGAAEESKLTKRDLLVVEGKLREEAKVTEALKKSHGKMQALIEHYVLDNDKLRAEVNMGKLESQKFSVLLAGKEVEINKYKQEIESFQKQITQQLSLLRSKAIESEVRKTMGGKIVEAEVESQRSETMFGKGEASVSYDWTEGIMRVRGGPRSEQSRASGEKMAGEEMGERVKGGGSAGEETGCEGHYGVGLQGVLSSSKNLRSSINVMLEGIRRGSSEKFWSSPPNSSVGSQCSAVSTFDGRD